MPSADIKKKIKIKIRIYELCRGGSLPSRIANETRHRVRVHFLSFSFCLFILISGIIINTILSYYYFHYNIILLLLLLYALGATIAVCSAELYT